jgi:D-alanyl-D-alanine dipeptidase
MHDHSIDGATGAIGQRDIDAAQVEWPWQAFASIPGTPSFQADTVSEPRQGNGIWNGFFGQGVNACRDELFRQYLRTRANDVAYSSLEAHGEAVCRGDEGFRVAVSDGTKPVAQAAVDGGDEQPITRRCLGKQHGCRAHARQRHTKPDGEPACSRQADTHTGEAAGADGDRDQVERTPSNTGFVEDGLDRRQELRSLVTPLLREGGKALAVTQDRHAKSAHGTIESQDRRHRHHRGVLASVRSAGHCWIMKLDLVAIAPPDFDVDVMLAYATDANLTGRPVYRNAECWLHRAAAEKLAAAIALARPLGLRLRIFDALRPVEAQWALWNAKPDPEFLADPRRGSPHSRGVAVDLTLLDGEGELDMGTPFDAFTPLSHHARTDISAEAQRNRLLLMGLMTSAGWDFYRNEWWHYQLFDQRRYPLVANADLPRPMM